MIRIIPKIKVIALSLLFLSQTVASAQWRPVDYASEEGRRIADQILLYQRVTGGWPKNVNMSSTLTPAQKAQVIQDKQRTDDSTVDNNATTSQMNALALAYAATGDDRYKEGFTGGLEFLLAGQYPNGGWPQFWPNPQDYQVNVTFNDNNMSNILGMFRNICDGVAPYGGKLVDDAMRARLSEAYDKGIDCILDAQIVDGKKLTVWCQQNDPVTLKPTTGRTYEIPSFCSAESVKLVQLLMKVKNPDKRVKAAIHGAMEWLDNHKITGYRTERGVVDGERTTRLVEDMAAAPLWARFYDLEYGEPIVVDRDGLPRRHLEQIGRERRNGYSWYNSNASVLYDAYSVWLKENDPRYKTKVSADSRGGNERGVFTMFRKHLMNPKDFDVVVKPGESIQAAIDKAPETADGYFKILVLGGCYHESLNVDRPNVLLVGEDRNNTVIELSEKDFPAEGNRRQSGVVINLTDKANDFIMSGFTLTNAFDASPLDPKQPQSIQHRMVVMGRADRTIIVNTTINSNGNDALSLWAQGGDGMYYHADLDINSPGVDFICPRGWCYATRCNFYGGGRAMIWHDGRGDINKKFVITNSNFDASCPTLLGRYHHDSMFYILSSRMSSNILNQNIHYAYSDQVKDPCPWGERIYYYNIINDSDNSNWPETNLSKAPVGVAGSQISRVEGTPLANWECTAQWTFDDRWNPEQTLRELWRIIEY